MMRLGRLFFAILPFANAHSMFHFSAKEKHRFGPKKCIRISKDRIKNTCVVDISCNDLSKRELDEFRNTEISFICRPDVQKDVKFGGRTDVLKHALGFGKDFAFTEHYDTNVVCSFCEKVPYIHPAKRFLSQKRNWDTNDMSKTSNHPGESIRKQNLLQVNSVTDNQLLTHGKTSFGPDNCVSVFSSEGNCWLETSRHCKKSSLANSDLGIECVMLDEFGQVVIGKQASSVLMFGIGFLQPGGKFNTMIQCDRCLGKYESHPDPILSGKLDENENGLAIWDAKIAEQEKELSYFDTSLRNMEKEQHDKVVHGGLAPVISVNAVDETQKIFSSDHLGFQNKNSKSQVGKRTASIHVFRPLPDAFRASPEEIKMEKEAIEFAKRQLMDRKKRDEVSRDKEYLKHHISRSEFWGTDLSNFANSQKQTDLYFLD